MTSGQGGGPAPVRYVVRFGPGGPVPPVVARLVALNVAVYLVQAFTGDWLTREFGLIPALVERGEVWRVFTYQFLHGGLGHLALNMFGLWMFGSELEQRWGSAFFLRYYMVCALGGGATFTLVSLGTWMASVGASGAVYGILMAYAMCFPSRRVHLYFVLPIPVRYFIGALIALELLQAIQSTGTGIAHAAHLGGMAFGYAYLRSKGVAAPRPFPTLSELRAWWGRRHRDDELRRRMRERGWDDRENLH